MVATRGHRDNEVEAKNNHPQRECRRSRTNFQEPEDELIWESDDTVKMPKTRSSVTFDCEKPLSSSPGAKSFTRDSRSKRNSDSKANVSEDENGKGATTRLLNKEDDMIGVEGDTDTDDDLFRHRKSSKRRSSRRTEESHHSPIKKEYVMNGDDEMTDKSDHENGLRRSLRQKPVSWILVDQKLRGYPNMIHSSEPENDEMRPARKASRYIRSSNCKSSASAPQRRSQRSRNKSPEQRISRNRKYLLREKKSRHHLSRSTRPKRLPLRYRESQSEDDDDEDDDDEEEEDVANEDEVSEQEMRGKKSMKERSSRNLRFSSRTRSRQRKEESQADSIDETENSDEETEYDQRVLRQRLRGRPSKKLLDFSERDASSETEGKDDEVLDKSQVEDEREEEEEEENENDMTPNEKVIALREKPKRVRKPVARLTYEPVRRRRNKIVSSDGDDDDDEENDAADEGEDGDEGKERPTQRGRYSLRQNRKTLVKDPYESDNSMRRNRKGRNRNAKMNKIFNSPARKQKIYNKKYRAAHNTASSSSSSSSDEKEFEKRFAKSINKARNRCLPMNFSPEDLSQSSVKDRTKIGSSLADIDPMHIDSSVSFDCVGGLSHHIKSLKEMIIFPLMYPEVFQKFSITPPRGVLFYGHPGTGKTLVARALASECSQKDRKVAFFMRKGADVLSKWVGESERQLRLLFDQAYQMRPSIIFFDEIDGLAPVRSSRQDQIHSSIVSTLLALMDGLDSRGEVVVIGATNRIDAIDPALRRPGRFDREFHFPLPSLKARVQIVNIHTRSWAPRPSKRLVQFLSEQTVGYCGADLKALCAEATLIALRFKYPQIYLSKDKLLLDVSKIHIKCFHFRQALAKIVPAGQRATSSPRRKLSKVVQPLMQPPLSVALRNLTQSFPHGFNRFNRDSSAYCPRLLICGQKGQGQTLHLAPALLHAMEKVHTHKLDLPSLFSVSARAPEEACAQVFLEARRNLPSIIYIPLLDQLWNTVSETVRATFLSLLNDFEPSTPILLLATAETPYNQMDEDVQKLFSSYRDELLVMSDPNEDIRRQFFRPLFFTKMIQKPKNAQGRKRVLETLPLAPPPQPRKLTTNELKKIEDIEEATLRELRIFLRQICAKLAKNRMFYIFTKPVDLGEVPDYKEVISQPMDLETMMTKIDHHQYECAEDFLRDVDLICANALEYNPDKNPEDKLIRHRACTLRDTAYAYIKAEMDTDFEMKCRDIRKARVYREQPASESAPDFIKVGSSSTRVVKAGSVPEKSGKNASEPSTPLNPNISADSGKMSSIELTRKKRRRSRSSWSRGMLSSASKKRKCLDKDKEEENKTVDNEAEAKKNNEENMDCGSPKGDEDDTNDADAFPNKASGVVLCNGNLSTEDSRDSMKVTSAADLLYNKSLKECIQKEKESLNESAELKGVKKIVPQIEADESVVSSSEPGCAIDKTTEVIIDYSHLEAAYESCISVTEGSTVDELQYLYNVLLGLTRKYVTSIKRDPLLSAVEIELRKFAQFRERP